MKTKKTFWMLLVMICVIGVLPLAAKDLIILKTGEEINAVVSEIGIDDILYKKADNIDGPAYRILQSDVFMIKYENGTKEVFSKPQAEKQTAKAELQELSYRSGAIWRDYDKLSTSEVRQIMSVDYAALEQFNKGRGMLIGGRVLLIPSAVICGTGLVTGLFTFAYYFDIESYSAVCMLAGGAGVALGAVLMSVGKKKLSYSTRLYNDWQRKETTAQLSVGLLPTGLGLCINF